jgi:hypothetical protein
VARVYGIKKRLAEQNIDEKLTKEIIGNGDLVDITTRMEKLLDPEITYQILDSCACGIGVKEIKGIKEIEADTLKEKINKIAYLGDFHSDWSVSLHQDNTLTAGWTIKENDNYACVCSSVVNNGVKVKDLLHENRSMPFTYCFCCAGHCRRHLQKLLDIQLRTREVVSSPINSKGQKPCEFIFEII